MDDDISRIREWIEDRVADEEDPVYYLGDLVRRPFWFLLGAFAGTLAGMGSFWNHSSAVMMAAGAAGFIVGTAVVSLSILPRGI